MCSFCVFKALAAMHFRFKDKEKPVQLVTRVSKCLHVS